MLRLRCCVLARFLSSPSASPTSQLSRLFSTTAPPAISPNPSFAVDEYLVATCGLTRAQALKASAKLSHLKSPSKPDAVLAFLTGLGLSGADVATLVAKDPRFLCASVERTLTPVVAGLTGLGLSRSEIARLVSLCCRQFRCIPMVCNVKYFLDFFGSFEDFFRVLKPASCLLSADLERVVRPNAAFLRECGLGDCDIIKLSCHCVPWILGTNPERVRAMVARAEGIGVPCGSSMFRHALHAVARLSEEKIAAQVEYLQKALRWSDAEVGIAVSKIPKVLNMSIQRVQSKSEFLISEAGLEPVYIAHRPVLLNYSLEGRLRPRYFVVRYLKENGLLDHDRDYYNTLTISKKVFMEKFISPHKEAAPHLAQDYADACRGQVPSRFRIA